MPSSPMLAGARPRLRPISQHTNWRFTPLSGLWLRSSTSTSIDWLLTFIWATIPLCMFWLQQSWILWVITGWPALPTTTSNCIIGWGKPISMWTPCQGCLGLYACPMPGHPMSSHCSGSMSHAGGCPGGPHKSHWSIQLWPVSCGPNGGWSTGHLYDCWRLAIGSAGRPCPGSGYGKDAEWDLGPVPIHADWLTQALAAPLGIQPPQAETGHPVQKGSVIRVPEGTVPVGMPSVHRETTLEGWHDEIDHLGLKKMLDLMGDCFFWPGMTVQVKEHVEKCCQCIIFKAKQ